MGGCQSCRSNALTLNCGQARLRRAAEGGWSLFRVPIRYPVNAKGSRREVHAAAEGVEARVGAFIRALRPNPPLNLSTAEPFVNRSFSHNPSQSQKC